MRVVVGYVVLVAVALTIAVLVTRQVLLTRLDRTIDAALAQEIEELRLLADGVDPATGEPFGTDVEALFDTFLRRSVPDDNEAYYTFVGGRASISSFGAPRELLADEMLVEAWSTVDVPTRIDTGTEVGPIRSLAVPLQADGDTVGVFVVVFFPDPERNEVFVAVRVIALTGLVVLVLSALAAWSLAGRVLRPVREMAHTAHRINDHDLSGRITVSGHDELADLGHTLNEMLGRLEHGFGAQRQFLDDVAHELRTPITIAQGHLDLLDGHPDDLAETIDIVRDELDRMSRYVTDLLVLAKAERPDFLRPEPVDLGELAATVLQRAAGLGQRQWVLDAAPAPGMVAVIADPGRLEQALLNLAGNAVEHTAPDDEIGLGVAVIPAGDGTAPRIDLWVRDTGAGVDPAVVDTMFRRDIRGATSRAGRREGMGIGLSIVDVIARAHHGSVSVHSLPGVGATFTISIPLDDPVAELHDADHHDPNREEHLS
jgi:two-component system, OmpR family, sensor kinase